MDVNDPHAFFEILPRLAAATLSGAVLGADRDLKDKPAGLRTLAMVSLGSALIVMTGVHDFAHPSTISESTSRVIQGIFAGIGFLGGGVILHHKQQNTVYGLTTATTIWMAAGIGVAWGLGMWELAVIGLGLAIVLLIPGVYVERWLMRTFKHPTIEGERPQQENGSQHENGR